MRLALFLIVFKQYMMPLQSHQMQGFSVPVLLRKMALSLVLFHTYQLRPARG